MGNINAKKAISEVHRIPGICQEAIVEIEAVMRTLPRKDSSFARLDIAVNGMKKAKNLATYAYEELSPILNRLG